jgi:hypothetical protein
MKTALSEQGEMFREIETREKGNEDFSRRK